MVIVHPDRHDDPASGFLASERALFAYRLGPGRPDYHADPIALDRRLEVAEATEAPGAARSALEHGTTGARLVGYRRLVVRAWAGFGLPSFREDRPDGLTIGEALVLYDRWIGWRDRLTLEFRAEAELVAIYGHSPDRPRSYRRKCGLWLNRSRAFGLAAAAQWRGALAASGRVRVDFDIVDALTPSLEAARRLDQDLEDERRAAEEAAARERSKGA